MWLEPWFEDEEALLYLAAVRRERMLLHDNHLASLLYRQASKRLDFPSLPLASSPPKRLRVEDSPPPPPPQQQQQQRAKSVLETRAESWGLTVVPIRGDGSCMFRAISHQLFGVENQHQSVRMLALQEVADHGDVYLPDLTEHERAKYLRDMESESAWGDEAMLRACAQCLDLAIVLVHDFKGDATPIQVRSRHEPLRPVYLGFYHELHYVSLVCEGN